MSFINPDEVAVYDRQIRLWGIDAQNRMRGSKNLIINLGGLSAEVVKNIVLAGVGSITIVDSKKVQPKDLSANFFLRETDDIGKKRAEAALPWIQKLNSRVEIRLETEIHEIKSLDEIFISQFNTVLATGVEFDDLCYLDDITHRNNQSFFAADLHGLYGYVFSDLVEHQFKIEREKPNMPTKLGPETSTRSILSTLSKREGEKHIEVLTKSEKYPSLRQVAEENSIDGKFGSQFKGRKLLKVSPLLPTLLAFWASNKNEVYLETFKPSVIKKAQDLGLPTGIITDEFIHSFISSLGAEFSPTAAVLGGVLAQDMLNILGQKEQPIQNLFLFDGNSNEGPIYTL